MHPSLHFLSAFRRFCWCIQRHSLTRVDVGLLCQCIRLKWKLLLQAETQATLKRLSPDTLMAVLRSDNLRVPSEMHVFRSVVSWLEADKSRLQQVKTCH